MKRFLVLLMLVITGIVFVGCSKDEKAVKVGILQYATHEALDAAREGFKEAILEANINAKFTVLNPEGETATLTTMANEIVRSSDIVLAIATPAALAVKTAAEDLRVNIPLLFTAVTDAEDAKLVDSNDKPSIMTGTSDLNPVADQLALVKEILPQAKKVGIIYTGSEPNSVVQVNIAKSTASNLGLEIVTATITSTNDMLQVTQGIINEVDALYLPTDNNVASGMAIIKELVIDNHKLVVCGEIGELSKGGMVTIGIDYRKLGKQTGVMAVKLIKGEKTISELPVEWLNDVDLVVNKKMSDDAGVSIPKTLLDRADRIITE